MLLQKVVQTVKPNSAGGVDDRVTV